MRSRCVRAGAVIATALLAGGLICPAAAAFAEALPAGTARVCFARPYEPYTSLAYTTLYANGAAIGVSQPGTTLCRDFAPGAYTFSVDSYLPDLDEAQPAQLAPGMQIYFEVWVDPNFASGLKYRRDMFYLLPLPPPFS